MKGAGLYLKNKELKAFTIAELLIAMVLSTLVIALGYWVLQGMERSFYSDKSRQEIMRDFLIFKTAFEKDAIESDSIVVYGDKVTISGQFGLNIDYFFRGDSIIRESIDYTDVFHPAFSYMEILTVNELSPLVKKIIFQFQPDSTLSFPYIFNKKYTAQIMLKEELRLIKESASETENHQLK